MTEFIIGFVIGLAVTWVVYTVLIMRATAQAKSQIEAMISEITQQTKMIIPARVERHDGVFYVYNAQDDTFMAQGNTLAELRQRIDSRWREAQVFVTEGDKDVLDALRATKTDLDTWRA